MKLGRGLVLLFAAAVIILYVGGALLVKTVVAHQDDISKGLVTACEQSPVRAALIDLYEDQIAQSKAADLEEFFPTIPPEELKALIHEQNQKRRARITELQSVDCSALYR